MQICHGPRKENILHTTYLTTLCTISIKRILFGFGHIAMGKYYIENMLYEKQNKAICNSLASSLCTFI